MNKNEQKRNNKRTLFCGTIDYLRRNTIQDLIETTKIHDEELWIVGKKNDTYLDEMIKDQPHVKYFPASPTPEKFIHECDTVASILLGRTAIEGWLCGKDALIYQIDKTGNIISKATHQPPHDMDKFKSDFVAKQIITEYKSILD